MCKNKLGDLSLSDHSKQWEYAVGLFSFAHHNCATNTSTAQSLIAFYQWLWILQKNIIKQCSKLLWNYHFLIIKGWLIRLLSFLLVLSVFVDQEGEPLTESESVIRLFFADFIRLRLWIWHFCWSWNTWRQYGSSTNLLTNEDKGKEWKKD